MLIRIRKSCRGVIRSIRSFRLRNSEDRLTNHCSSIIWKDRVFITHQAISICPWTTISIWTTESNLRLISSRTRTKTFSFMRRRLWSSSRCMRICKTTRRKSICRWIWQNICKRCRNRIYVARKYSLTVSNIVILIQMVSFFLKTKVKSSWRQIATSLAPIVEGRRCSRWCLCRRRKKAWV